jgi:hypothetical protein
VFLVTRSSEEEKPIDLLFKWLADSELLIAVPDEKMPSEQLMAFRELEKAATFKGIALRYEYYPGDPNILRDAGSRKVVRKRAAFAYRFERIKNLLGLPSVGCSLYLTVLDGTYFDRLSIRLSANRTFSHKASGSKTLGTVTVPEHVESSMLFAFYQRRVDFSGEPTAAAIDHVLPRRQTSVRNWKPVQTPAGGFAPARQLYSSIDQNELMDALQSVRKQTFDVRVAFWLENLEVLYSNSEHGDVGALDDFQRCLSDSAILARAS